MNRSLKATTSNIRDKRNPFIFFVNKNTFYNVYKNFSTNCLTK